MKKWTVYILKCADKSYYTGIALDVKKRLVQHRARKGSKCLMGRLPVHLVYKENVSSKSAALRREAAVKKLTHDEKHLLVKRKTLLPK